jgi:hypothetical protein
VNTLCKLMECLLLGQGAPDMRAELAKIQNLIATTFVFCYLWAIGGNILDTYWDAFDTFMRQLFDELPEAKVNAYVKLLFSPFFLLKALVKLPTVKVMLPITEV